MKRASSTFFAAPPFRFAGSGRTARSSRAAAASRTLRWVSVSFGSMCASFDVFYLGPIAGVDDIHASKHEPIQSYSIVFARIFQPMPISQSEYARRRGVSRQYVSRLVKEGVIRLENGKVDPARADAALKAAKNTLLGETWAERGEAPDWQRLYERREDYTRGSVPMGGLFLTAGADVQHDRIEVDIWAWGRGLQSWLVDHILIDGDPARQEVWTKLTKLLSETWPHEAGGRLALSRLAIDSGDGRNTAAVYAWARAQGPGQVMAVKGKGGFERSAPVSGPTYVDITQGGRKLKRGVRLWTVSVAVFKSETYRFLRLDRPTDEELAEDGSWPEGYIHLPKGIDAEWVRQLTAEQLVTVRNRQGFTRLEWQKLRERNEALDNRVYARAAAWVSGIDRWPERKWRELERQAGVQAEDEEMKRNRGHPTASRRRIIRSPYMGR